METFPIGQPNGPKKRGRTTLAKKSRTQTKDDVSPSEDQRDDDKAPDEYISPDDTVEPTQKQRVPALPPSTPVVPVQPVQPAPPVPAQPAAAPVAVPMQQLESDLDRVVTAGLQPLHLFVSILAVKLGDHDTKQYYSNAGPVLVKGAASLDELIVRNMHLGKTFLRDTIVHLAGPTIPVADGMQDWVERQHRGITLATIEEVLARAPPSALGQSTWSFNLMDETVFAYLLSTTTLGAMILARDYVRRTGPHTGTFTLKELVASESVRDVFASVCAYHFLSASGGSAYSGSQMTSKGKVVGTNLMVSAGIKTRQLLQVQMTGAKIFFENVFRNQKGVLVYMEPF